MGYRPFGKYNQVGGYRVGDQWEGPPDDLRRAVDGDEKLPLSRFERWVYRLLDRPSLLRRRR
jgi:hypothetical protein